MINLFSSIGGQISGFGPLGQSKAFADPQVASNTFTRVISIIIGLLTMIAGLYFTFQFILGAFSWLSSGGDKAKLQEAQKKITNAVIGLTVVIISVFIIDLIGLLLGIDILSPGDFILGIWGRQLP